MLLARKLLCCKRTFDWIKANLTEIQLKKHQNVQKTHFLQNIPRVNGLILAGKMLLMDDIVVKINAHTCTP